MYALIVGYGNELVADLTPHKFDGRIRAIDGDGCH
jgi:hypothetical protein